MARKERRKTEIPSAEDELDALKDEVAADLGLEDDIAEEGWENMTTREVGKIGGHMVKKMVRFAEKEMDRRDGRIKD
ncbi:alpha/beta-type small acid-soluble spore protein [Gelria sp. Kuro-4]|jgi:phage-related protein|uniref:alpha/beta-type small acid-soluble spore protein n=1 Tax=Gelria sp. Kuro-4 TaxID=2796927 RepID=UPI001BEFDFA2|nr:alpha/beta-type small acid-soluble spore protein [Gelria sp. Kuro-4]BCV24675.1 Small, acid-soluble spore protein, alpha/beta type [Gelria sp. Kuro-4]